MLLQKYEANRFFSDVLIANKSGNKIFNTDFTNVAFEDCHFHTIEECAFQNCTFTRVEIDNSIGNVFWMCLPPVKGENDTVI